MGIFKSGKKVNYWTLHKWLITILYNNDKNKMIVWKHHEKKFNSMPKSVYTYPGLQTSWTHHIAQAKGMVSVGSCWQMLFHTHRKPWYPNTTCWQVCLSTSVRPIPHPRVFTPFSCKNSGLNMIKLSHNTTQLVGYAL